METDSTGNILCIFKQMQKRLITLTTKKHSFFIKVLKANKRANIFDGPIKNLKIKVFLEMNGNRRHRKYFIFIFILYFILFYFYFNSEVISAPSLHSKPIFDPL